MRQMFRCLSLLFLIGIPASGQTPDAQPAAQPDAASTRESRITAWQEQLRDTHRKLLDQSWTAARDQSRTLLDDLMNTLKAGPDSATLVAAALAQLALAESGLGLRGDAQWHYFLAQNFNPAFQERGVGDYGPASAALENERLRAWGGPPAGREIHSLTEEGITSPRLVESPFMVFQASADVLRAFPKDLSVEVIVDRNGEIRHPVVRGSLINPGPVLVSLELLRLWRLDPATKDGQPLSVFLYLPLPLTKAAVEGVKAALESP